MIKTKEQIIIEMFVTFLSQKDVPQLYLHVRSLLEKHLSEVYDNNIEELHKGHDRYEKIRKLTVPQFADLFRENLITGKPFDQLVDEL